MKKKYYIGLIILIIIVLLTANVYTKNKYKINLFKYFEYRQGLTTEEEKLLEREDVLIYSSDKSSPPMRFKDPQDGQYKGGVIDYMNSLSVELGKEIKFKPLVWQEALDQLKEGKTDICDMFYSKKRAENYHFTDPVYLLRSVLLIKRNNQYINKLDDLKGKKVAMQKKDYAVDYVKSNIGDSVNYYLVSNIEEAIELLVKNKVDAVIGDEPVVTYFSSQKNLNNQVKIVNPPLYEKYIRLAVPKAKKNLIPILNKGIFALRRKGILEGIQQKWFGLSGSIMNKTDNDIFSLLLKMILGLIIITSIFLIWNYFLKKKIRQRTRELENSRNKLQTIFDGITDLMIVINKDYKIENANKAFCEYIDLPRDEIIERECSSLERNDKQFELINYCTNEKVKRSLVDKKDRVEEINAKNKVYRMSVFPINGEDNSTYDKVLLVFRDITKELLNEKKLFHANKMAAIGQLAAGMAHEIRNPLGLIRTYTYLIKNKIKDIDGKIGGYFTEIEEAIEKISRIIDNLLNTSHRGDNQKQWINIYQFVNRLISLQENKMSKITCEIRGKKDVECYINKDVLEYIVFNLISNAIDAISGKGKIMIKFGIQNDSFVLSVADTGEGIDNSDINNIFNPFFTTKPPGKGTGLGLYIVYTEIEKLKGEINVVSRDGSPTTFNITLPITVRRQDDEKSQ